MTRLRCAENEPSERLIHFAERGMRRAGRKRQEAIRAGEKARARAAAGLRAGQEAREAEGVAGVAGACRHQKRRSKSPAPRRSGRKKK